MLTYRKNKLGFYDILEDGKKIGVANSEHNAKVFIEGMTEVRKNEKESAKNV